MTEHDKELVSKVARAINNYAKFDCAATETSCARAAITAAKPLLEKQVRADEREKILREFRDWYIGRYGVTTLQPRLQYFANEYNIDLTPEE